MQGLNVYIHTGYRINFNTIGRAFWSLFKWHNETVNVWSHLMGFNLFLMFIVYLGVCNQIPAYLGNDVQYDFEKAPSFHVYLSDLEKSLPGLDITQ